LKVKVDQRHLHGRKVFEIQSIGRKDLGRGGGQELEKVPGKASSPESMGMASDRRKRWSRRTYHFVADAVSSWKGIRSKKTRRERKEKNLGDGVRKLRKAKVNKRGRKLPHFHRREAFHQMGRKTNWERP